MVKNQVLEMVKEKMELSTKKDAELFIERLGDLLKLIKKLTILSD